MEINRRNMLKSSAVVGAAALASSQNVSASEYNGMKFAGGGVFRLSSQEGPMPGNSLEEKLDHMEEWGFEAVELYGKTTINKKTVRLPERVKDVKAALKGRDIKVSAICAGFDGVPASHDPAERKRAVESIKYLLGAAGELESTGLIIVPAFNWQTSLGVVGARYVFMDIANELGDAAQAAGTRILLEPLNRKETWYLRQLADAAAICKEVNNPGLCMMGDFYHMGFEEPCEYSAFLAARDYLHHVHLASRPNRKQPGYDKSDFRPGFRALKEIGFQEYCSFECGIEGDKLVEIPKAVKYLKQQWKEA